VVAYHLSRLGPESTPSEELPIDDSFPDKQLLAISQQATPWYADMMNFKVCSVLHPGLSYQQKRKFFTDAKYSLWEDHFLYKLYRDGIYRDACLKKWSIASYTTTMP